MVTRLDRLARSTRDLLDTLALIAGKDVGFRSLGDTRAEATTALGCLMLTILGGLVAFERELIRARTGEGRERAVVGGVHEGREETLHALAKGKATQAAVQCEHNYDFEALTMCALLGIESNWWSVGGLATDFIGVIALGFDLVRVQRMLRSNANAELDHFMSMADEYGGVEAWAAEIKKNARWIPSSTYEEYHAQDPVSYNVERNMEGLSELAECVNGLAKHLSEIVVLSQKKLESDGVTAKTSLALSYIGLTFILVGFLGQLIGSWFMALSDLAVSSTSKRS